ncbi:GFA family protein [Pantoea sp.]|uniref:GFA family protein n=1 Tax=Pantoea sp. TaxID=69393 RepID=UPI0028A86580|nr:GFA family protein [Pantoea sp.]
MKGTCLCETVTFELTVTPAFYYRCHCSLCRKQSGTGHNLATLVKERDFTWLSGETQIASWSRPSGYRCDFCSRCGAAVPNRLRGHAYIWIPVGLLDEPADMQCIGDYCTDDAMPWDTTRSATNHAGPVASLNALLGSLKLVD